MVLILHAHGVKLADGWGEGEPEITNEEICFNGVRNCGHLCCYMLMYNDIGGETNGKPI